MHFQSRQRLASAGYLPLDFSGSADQYLVCRLEQGGLVYAQQGRIQTFPLPEEAGPASVHPATGRLAFQQNGFLCLSDLQGELLASKRLGALRAEALAFDARGRLAMLSRHDDYTLLSWLDDQLVSRARRAFPPLDDEQPELHLVPGSSLAVVVLSRGQLGGKLVVCRADQNDLAVLASRECPAPIHGLSLAADGRHLLLGQPDAVELWSLPDLSVVSRLALPGWMGFGGGFIEENRALWPNGSGQLGYLIARVGDELFSDGSLLFDEALHGLKVSGNGWLLACRPEFLDLGRLAPGPAPPPPVEEVEIPPVKLNLTNVRETFEDSPDAPEAGPDESEGRGRQNQLKLAISLWERGRLAEALDCLRDPDSADGWELRSRLQILSGQTDQAAHSLKRYLELNPRDLPARLTAARLSKNQQDFLALLELLSQARPDWLMVSQAAFFGFGALEKARAAAEQALQLEPYSARAWVWKARLELEANLLEEARESLQRGLNLVPNLAEGWYWLGLVQSRLHHNEEALEAYRRGAKLAPNNRRLAQALHELTGQPIVAEEYDDWTL